MIQRRKFMKRLTAGALFSMAAPTGWSQDQSDSPAAKPSASQASSTSREVRLEWMMPAEINAAMTQCSTLFQPLGTIEWHGLHNVVGLDALKAQMLCIRAAQAGGGVVAPPLFGGVGGLDEPHTFVMEPENDIHSILVRSWVEKLCREAVRQGFKAIIILTGHYGAAQQMVIRDVAMRQSRALGIPVLGTPEYFLALDKGYLGDHAAWGETALMLHLAPKKVDLSRLGNPPYQGVGGRDPKQATPADGRLLSETICERLASLSRQMPQWDTATLRDFIDAESALVSRQMLLAASEKNVWAGWRNIGKGVISAYGQLLVERKFKEIVELTQKL